MKIGIFGDSYAAINTLKSRYCAWPEILAQKYNVSNYAVAGSSALYSIQQIQSIHTYYDRIIFVVTHPGRIMLNCHVQKAVDNLDLQYHNFIHLTGDPEQINARIKEVSFDMNENKVVIKKALQAALQYVYWLKESKNDEYIHKLMIDDIKRLRSDIIFIPAFSNSLQEHRISMSDIHHKENEYWKNDLDKIDKELYSDFRFCHMIDENNEIFATNVIKWLNGEPVAINLDDYVYPSVPFTQYFEMR